MSLKRWLFLALPLAALAACSGVADAPAEAVGPPQYAAGGGPAPPPGELCPYCNLYDNEMILDAAIDGVASRCAHEGSILRTMRNEGRLFLQHGVSTVDTNWTTMTITTRTGMALTNTRNSLSDWMGATTAINTAWPGWERELENTLSHEKGHLHFATGTEAQADGTVMSCGVIWAQ